MFFKSDGSHEFMPRRRGQAHLPIQRHLRNRPRRRRRSSSSAVSGMVGTSEPLRGCLLLVVPLYPNSPRNSRGRRTTTTTRTIGETDRRTPITNILPTANPSFPRVLRSLRVLRAMSPLQPDCLWGLPALAKNRRFQYIPHTVCHESAFIPAPALGPHPNMRPPPLTSRLRAPGVG